jgi:hypothetical protein
MSPSIPALAPISASRPSYSISPPPVPLPDPPAPKSLPLPSPAMPTRSRPLHFAKVYLHSVEGAGWPVTWWDLLLLALWGVHRSRAPGMSLAWAAWLRLRRCNTLPMKEVGELTVCSTRSSENYWCMVEPRFQPCVAEDISPCPISVSGAAFSVSTPCVIHRCSLSFAGVISRKRHGLRPGRTRA